MRRDPPEMDPAWRLVRLAGRPGTDADADADGGAAVLLARDDHERRWVAHERLHHLFEDRARRWGDDVLRVAVETDTRRTTYAELADLANRMARFLHDQGVGPGSRVALLLDRSELAVAAVLACSRLAAAYVPVDAAFPADRIAFIVGDADVTVAVTSSALAGHLAGCGVPVVELDSHAAEIARHPSTPFELGALADDPDPLAYVIYTSGSTGRPKGVPICHSSIVNFLRVAADVYGYRDDDRVYQGLTMAFDFSVEEVWVPLMVGATLVPAPATGALVGADLTDFLVAHRISALCCVPTLLATLEPPLPQLRFLLVSGEACPADLIARWLAPGRRVLNAYGPTEATVTATWSVVRAGRAVTIGGPLPTYAIVVLDPDEARALEPGEVGEIAIAGAGLSAGYLNRPEQTAKAFVEDFIGIPTNTSGLLYRTGDLGRITPEREIEYLGRLDAQVKIRGYRIELDEIEAIARTAPNVGNAVVQPVTMAGAAGPELVAYLTPIDPAEPIDIDRVDAVLRRSLPAYMVPAYFELLEALPLLPSTKVDRAALPPPAGRRHVGSAAGPVVPPRTPLETRLRDILGGIIGLSEISVDAHFIEDLGTNSLTLATYITAVRDQLGRRVAVKDLYRHPTIAGLAALLEPARSGSVVGADTDRRDPSVPLPRVAPHVPSRFAVVATAAAQLSFWVGFSFVSAVATIWSLRFVSDASGVVDSYVNAVVAGTATFVGMAALLIAVKWLMVGRGSTRPIPVHSARYVRFWIARRAIQVNPLGLLAGSPLYNGFLRLLGVRVGAHAVLFCRPPACPNLVSIGARAVLRERVVVNGYSVRDGYVVPGRVEIGPDALVAEATVIDIDTSIGARAQVGHGSGVLRGQHVPPDERYQGSPAEPSTTRFDRLTTHPRSRGRTVRYVIAVAASVGLLRLPFTLGLVLVVHRLGVAVDHLTSLTGRPGRVADAGVFAAIVVAGGLVGGMVRVVVIPRLLNRFVVPGEHPIHGLQYQLARGLARFGNHRLLVALLGDSALILGYLRAIGYDVRDATQTGSNVGMVLRQHSPFLCRFRRNTLVSDGLWLVNMEVSATSFRLRPIDIPDDTYMGNAVSFPGGAAVGPNCLVATKAAVPIDGPLRRDVGLLGSPAFEIPRSVVRDHEFDHLKAPGVIEGRMEVKLWANVLTMELYLIRSWLLTWVSALLVVEQFPGFTDSDSVIAAGAAASAALVIAVVAAFPILLGFERASRGFRPLRPQYCSLYDATFWDHERTWKLNYNSFLAPLAGTPLRPVLLRWAGARIGRGVFDDGAVLTEPSLVAIGDHCTINAGVTIQSHSLEDGTFKSDRIEIGRGCTLATGAFVHYGTELRDGAVLEADAFLMKGARIDEQGRWLGNPAWDAAWPDDPVDDADAACPVTSPSLDGTVLLRMP